MRVAETGMDSGVKCVKEVDNADKQLVKSVKSLLCEIREPYHRGLLNFTMSTIAQNKLTTSDRIGHHFSFSFDSHIEDLYPPLVVGASIHIMSESIRRDTDLIYSFLVEHNITGGGFTTAIGWLLVMNYELPQRYVALMGEDLT